jgi:HEAT repeat protein
MDFAACINSLRTGDTAEQETTANAIAGLRDISYLPLIEAHLGDGDPLVRRVMLWTLRNYAGRISYPRFLSYLHDPDMMVREAALLLFMEGGTEASAVLASAVLSRDEGLQFAAIQALGQFRTPDAPPSLIRALQSANPDIREVAVLSLGVYPDDAVKSVLISVLSDVPAVRLAALHGLLHRSLSADDTAAVCSCLSSEDPEIRAAAVRLLGNACPDPVAGDASPVVRKAVASAVVRSAVLEQLCSDTDASVRTAAAESAGRSCSGMEDVLLPMLSDEVPGVRRAAVSALEGSPRPEVVPALIACLKDPKPGVRAAAATALGNIGGEDAIVALKEAAECGNPVLHGIITNAIQKAAK